jgi:hypothetical protein
LTFWYPVEPASDDAVASAYPGCDDRSAADDLGDDAGPADTLGRLQEFHAIPPQYDPDPAPASPPRWGALFEAAGMNLSAFTPVTPQWAPRDFADTRAAWEGPLVDRPDLHVRVEAAAYRGRPVSMLMVGPWSRPARMETLSRSNAQTVLIGLATLVIVALVIAAMLLARYNVRAKRTTCAGLAARAVHHGQLRRTLGAGGAPSGRQSGNEQFCELREHAGGRRLSG